MTSSSSPGIALKQEGISYIAGAELPCVIVNVMRGGPGLGGIQPSQADYKQVTRGGGNGDYYTIAYAPENLQETVDIMKMSFEVADYYRNPVMIAVDGLIGQMMESVDMDRPIAKRKLQPKTWATAGHKENEERHIVSSLYLDPLELSKHNEKLHQKYMQIKENEQLYEKIDVDDAEYIIVAYGTMARICRSAMEECRKEGIRVGMIRPITIWPYPEKAFRDLKPTVKGILCAELSMGQMIDDVMIVNQGRFPVHFFGKAGGILPEVEEISEAIHKMKRGAQ
jgi:2-oxoglutarate ferredoxin oxidoreductase subunit alpha